VSRVVVVGAGVGGLAAAIRLAAGGHRVTLLEQADSVGGKLGTFRRDGFTFDTGPSLLTMPHVFAELFASTGAPLEDELDLVRLDTACRYRFADGTWLDLPGTREAVPAALEAGLGPDRGRQWESFMQRAERIWDAVHGPFLESPLTGVDLVRLSRRLDDLRAVAPGRTLRGLGADHLRDPRLRALLDRYATYTGSDPRRAPAALATVPYVEQQWGSWHVRGGLGRLADALLRRAVDLGVDVRTGCLVEEVVVEGGRAAGVRVRPPGSAAGEVVAADVVVSNADAGTVYGGLLRDPAAQAATRGARRRLSRATPSLSGFVLLLALDGRDVATPHHTVLFAEDYDDEFDSVFGVRGLRRRRPPRPVPAPTVYVSAPDDPALRPDDGTEGWFVLVNAPPHAAAGAGSAGVDWDTPGLADDYAGSLLDLMARRGLDVRGRVRWQHVLTPADLMRTTRSPGGSIYGSSSNGSRAAFLRPANRSPLPGLFLVGGSAHPGGGLPLVTLSARIVGELVGPA
jgi:phytoene desaturase